MQKVSHFWAQMKKNAKCQLGRFCPEPFYFIFLFYEQAQQVRVFGAKE